MIRHPAILVRQHFDDVLRELPSIRDGDPGAVHRARVASRRLRDVLPLCPATRSDVAGKVKTLGRALGTVRELDVMSDVLAAAEQHIPGAAAAAATARQAIVARQRKDRRRLIKALEGSAPEEMLAAKPLRSVCNRALTSLFASRGWEREMRLRLGARADDLDAAVEHASGVYFPNRLHKTRVAVKKVRYSVETVSALGQWQPPRLLKDLRRIQALLGEIHDFEAVAAELDDLVAPEEVPASRIALQAGLRAEVDRRFAEYLRLRDRLHGVARACRRFARRSTPEARALPSFVAVTRVLVPTMALVASCRNALREKPPSARARPAAPVRLVSARFVASSESRRPAHEKHEDRATGFE
jgi:CHAD domain-containing protein